MPVAGPTAAQRDGHATYADGTVYVGEFPDGQRHGNGTDHHARRLHLYRRMESGEIEGAGVATYANGDVYEGNFVAGKRQGEGTIRYATGQEAVGTWENGALDAAEPPPAAAPPETAPATAE